MDRRQPDGGPLPPGGDQDPDWDETERDTLMPFRDELKELRERHRDDPPLELLRAARAEVLPEPVQKAVTAHLAENPWLRALAAGADAVEPSPDPDAASRLLARIKLGNHQHADTPSRNPGWSWVRRRTWVLAIGSVGALIVLGAVLVQHRARNASATNTSAQQAPAATQQTASAPPPPPPGHLVLEKPDVKLTPLALVLRGPRDGGAFIDDLAPALNAYRANDYGTAARELQALDHRYPKAVEVSFYLGVSQLLLGEPDKGLRALEKARRLSDETFRDDARWYLAIAYERTGHVDRARGELDALCRGRSTYAARACSGAAALDEK